DAVVDLAISSAVWEHLKHPHQAMQEVARVTKPGALFVGNIAFGQPFHISYFHHSPLAAYCLLDAAGFETEQVVLNDAYRAFLAHWEMGYAGQKLPSWLQRVLAAFIRLAALAPAALRGRYQAGRLAFARSHAAAVGFIARRRCEPSAC